MNSSRLGLALTIWLTACGGGTLVTSGTASNSSSGGSGTSKGAEGGSVGRTDETSGSSVGVGVSVGSVDAGTADAGSLASSATGSGDGSAASGGFDGSILDGALPDASASPIETFEYIVSGVPQKPRSCASSHWEYPGSGSDSALAADAYLRNTGSVPLAYSVGCLVGNYPPGVPRGGSKSVAGVLAPGASVNLGGISPYVCGPSAAFANLGSSKPFSIYDGGYAAADEGTIPWPEGVSGSEGSPTMYVAQLETVPSCAPVAATAW